MRRCRAMPGAWLAFGDERRPVTVRRSSRCSAAFRWSASRIASARIVTVGVPAPEVGNTELPATNRLSMLWTRQCSSTTPRRGSRLIRVVPMWWPRIPCSGAGGQTASMAGCLRSRPRPSRSHSSAIASRVFAAVAISRPVVRQSIDTRGIPSASRSSASVTRLAAFGACSSVRCS